MAWLQQPAAPSASTAFAPVVEWSLATPTLATQPDLRCRISVVRLLGQRGRVESFGRSKRKTAGRPEVFLVVVDDRQALATLAGAQASLPRKSLEALFGAFVLNGHHSDDSYRVVRSPSQVAHVNASAVF